MQDSKRVLFVATLFQHLAAFHRPFMRRLLAQGHDVHAAASAREGRMEQVQNDGVTCWDIPFRRSPYHPGNVQAVYVLVNLLRKARYDLIHTHTPVASFLTRYLARRTGQGRVLYTAHGFHFYQGAPMRSWLLYRTAELLARPWNSEDLQHAKSLGYEKDENLFLVHGVGVDTTLYYPANAAGNLRRELGLSDDTQLVCCIAEFTPNKNHAVLFESWHQVSAAFPMAHLLLVGSTGRCTQVQRQAANMELPRVHFLGRRDDVPDILRQVNVLVLISRREGLPRVVIEAMATGVPVVASAVRGNRDLVRPGTNGWLVDPSKPAECAEALMECLADPEQGRRLGANGRRLVEPYLLGNVCDELDRIYGHYLC